MKLRIYELYKLALNNCINDVSSNQSIDLICDYFFIFFKYFI